MRFTHPSTRTLLFALIGSVILAIVILSAWFVAFTLPLLAPVSPAEETQEPFITFIDPVGGTYSMYQPLQVRLKTGTFIGEGSVQFNLIKDGPETNANRPDESTLYLGTKSVPDEFSGEMEITIEADQLYGFSPDPGAMYVITASPHDYSGTLLTVEARTEPFTFQPISKAPECWLSAEEVFEDPPGYGHVDGIISVGEPYLVKQHLLDVTEGYFLSKKVAPEAHEFYYGICDRDSEECRPYQTWSAVGEEPGYQHYTLIARGPYGITSCELSVQIVGNAK